jgi:hypothetical protein
MTAALLRLLPPLSQQDVEVAWATLRALTLAEVDDPDLLNDDAHQQALELAKDRFHRLYDEWSRS